MALYLTEQHLHKAWKHLRVVIQKYDIGRPHLPYSRVDAARKAEILCLLKKGNALCPEPVGTPVPRGIFHDEKLKVLHSLVSQRGDALREIPHAIVIWYDYGHALHRYFSIPSM